MIPTASCTRWKRSLHNVFMRSRLDPRACAITTSCATIQCLACCPTRSSPSAPTSQRSLVSRRRAPNRVGGHRDGQCHDGIDPPAAAEARRGGDDQRATHQNGLRHGLPIQGDLRQDPRPAATSERRATKPRHGGLNRHTRWGSTTEEQHALAQPVPCGHDHRWPTRRDQSANASSRRGWTKLNAMSRNAG